MTIRDGVCPRCNSDEIYHKKTLGQYRVPSGFLGSGPNPMLYVCADCGYYEHYIISRSALENIRKKWTPANKKRKRKNDKG